MTLVKICGITNLDDALAAVAAGADALGFNFYKPSPRYISPQHAREIIEQLPESLLTVGVFVNEESADAVGSIADESDTFDVETPHAYEVQAIMLDTKHNTLRGGTGRVFDWSVAQRAAQNVPRLFLAGGLSPENIENAVEMVRPYAVDACSALEDSPGKKNHERMRVFVNTVRRAAP